jgi:hypothetical protein
MQHKWHKEIKAWADGEEIEFRYILEGKWTKWYPCELICATFIQTKDEYEYRIKPQPKEPQYLYVFCDHKGEQILRTHSGQNKQDTYIGKIKLED